jgi:hypothetical protein
MDHIQWVAGTPATGCGDTKIFKTEALQQWAYTILYMPVEEQT